VSTDPLLAALGPDRTAQLARIIFAPRDDDKDSDESPPV
jgi:hypothetical protein